uniref:Spectrin repeat containing, nuclear envelope 2b n=1 Tax=Callorhinchus milii TaxID=7868 RepID=A0A4W3HWU3_CALMI
MEEIHLYTDNKLQIEQLGKQLIQASTGSKASDIESKLQIINNHWQHLFEVIEARVGKLKETLHSVWLLDTDMSNLRSWLSRIESELSKPLVYNICDSDEIQRKLTEQQELQRDIEQHSTGVASVLNLCDVLLHDADACATDTECDSIQQTTRSLDKRWRNICALSVERRMKIEETWRLWQKFLDDYSRFEEWLKEAELTSAHPNSSQVLHVTAREELKRFEGFQRQVHERLTQLELINKLYRRLARENRVDCASKLRHMVHEGNQRWDSLQRRVAAILRRLKHFTSQRDEFEGWREGLLVWLTEMDLQLTNIEHFSESDRDDKMRQLNAFQQEITLYTNKIDQLIVFGEQLIQKSEPGDAVMIEDELEELHAYCQEVFGRVARFHQRLMSRRPVCDDERELSDREMEMESQDSEALGEASDGDSLPLVSGGPGQRLELSGRGTPVSVDSIPLEWDHTVDVGGSSSHEEEDDNDYFSGLSGTRIVIPSSPDTSLPLPTNMLTPQLATQCRHSITLSYPPGQASDTSYNRGYVRLLSECSGSIDSIRRVSDILQDEETSQPPGLVHLSNLEKPAPGVIERWELLHAQAVSKQLRVKHDLQQWQQLNSDLQDISTWLAQIQPHLTPAKNLEPATSIHTIEEKIRRLRDIQKAFDNYKAIVISVNLSSRDFLQTESEEAGALHQRLHNVNHMWNSTSQSLEASKLSLQAALLACQDFHLTTHGLLVWLAGAEARRGAVCVSDPSLDSHTLAQHRHDLMSLERELLERQVQVKALQDMASQLLVTADGEDCIEAKEKVHVISNKLKLLLREVAEDLHSINLQLVPSATHTLTVLALSPQTSTQPSHRMVSLPEPRSREVPGAARSLLARVLRAAFPLQLCILLLLLLSCLLPLGEDDYSCALANNFARSFYPMLRYTNGPPPT